MTAGPRNVLITNNTFALRAGTELYTRDVALALNARGHRVAVYSTLIGDLSDELERDGIGIVDDLRRLDWKPDVIHGQHHLETMTAVMLFPDTPTIYVCHGWLPWEEIAPRHPSIVGYVAVDQPSRRAVSRATGLSSRDVVLLPNPVNLSRFKSRGPLPSRPGSALLMSNYAAPADVVPVRQACEARGIRLDAFGLRLGRTERSPERALRSHDLVFATGRTALEAAAVGAAAILFGPFGVGPMVTSTNMRHLRTLEGDYENLVRPADAETIGEEIDRYDSEDAARVSRWVRAASALDDHVDQLCRLYEEAIAAHSRRDKAPRSSAEAASAYLRWLSAQHKQGLDPSGAGMVLRGAILSLQGRISAWVESIRGRRGPEPARISSAGNAREAPSARREK